ncbi:hypothetical protein CPHO_02725 [Corynebacterium phocae]|uniref:Thioredoxin-like fold domain-containing protein n=1 Tax=Corynebacterium phocae TaxID=161895 RepID=A0A1L7D1U0_9CORY|nr:thioredoxin domain-containing protein [Corynebacterium phocae]APT91992.1 hypothetical protein CPHO_02725 [Corynebacterium phocae]KAA8726368.1 thioredoxin domain-containing protein [Corynebacterium phocae]
MSIKVSDPNSKSNSGFIWALVVLLAIVAAVIGYIVWNGQNAKTEHLAEREVEQVAMTMEYDPEDPAVVLSSDKADKDTKTFDLYEDASCPHCSELAEATDADMKTAIEAGEINVAIHPLSFLDGKDFENQDGHSTKAVAALLAAAQAGDATTYWNLRKVIFEQQQDIYNKWTMSDFANAAKELGADSKTVKAIEDADLKEAGKAAGANAAKLEKETGKLSSPRVIFEGKDLNSETEPITDWVELAKSK